MPLSMAVQSSRLFKAIYSGKRSHWKAKELSEYLSGKLSPKRVTECGKRMVGDGLIRQLPDAYPIVYEKIPDIHHYKARILSLAQSSVRRAALPTKRKPKVSVTVLGTRARTSHPSEVTIDDIDQFSRVRKLKGASTLLKPLSERRFKSGLQKIFKDTGKYPDWGGERDDFFTNKLKMKGKRYSTAFTLKGPGVGVKTMTPGKWGKRGNQIQRLLSAPARVFLLQFEGQIDEDSIEQLWKFTDLRARQEHQKLFYGYIDRDDWIRLRRAYAKYF